MENTIMETTVANTLQVFTNEELNANVRVIVQGGEYYFVAADVCKSLDIQNTTQAVAKLDDDEKAILNIGLQGGATNCVNEYGLYNLILGSRKPEAKQFKRWVTSEILPTLGSKINNSIQVFDNSNFGSIRCLEINGDPWFVAKDVCDCLEIGNPSQALSRLCNDEKGSIILNEGTSERGGSPVRAIVNEPGLYRLIFSSRKPEAEEFRRWVYHDVLPSIRKTGGYGYQGDTKKLEEMMRKIVEYQEKNSAVLTREGILAAVKESLYKEFIPRLIKQNQIHLSSEQFDQLLEDWQGTHRGVVQEIAEDFAERYDKAVTYELQAGFDSVQLMTDNLGAIYEHLGALRTYSEFLREYHRTIQDNMKYTREVCEQLRRDVNAIQQSIENNNANLQQSINDHNAIIQQNITGTGARVLKDVHAMKQSILISYGKQKSAKLKTEGELLDAIIESQQHLQDLEEEKRRRERDNRLAGSTIDHISTVLNIANSVKKNHELTKEFHEKMDNLDDEMKNI